MWKYLVFGGGVALSAALQPGPLQAFYFSKVAQQGWRRTLPAAFSPLLSDGPIALVSIFLIQQLPVELRAIMQLGGGVLLLTYAAAAYRQLRQPSRELDHQRSSSPKTVFQAALINLLNPSPYLGWSLVMGPAVLSAWSEQPSFALAMLGVFYFVMISTSLLLIALMGTTSFLGEQGQRSLLLVSCLLLTALGGYYFITAAVRLLGRLLG